LSEEVSKCLAVKWLLVTVTVRHLALIEHKHPVLSGLTVCLFKNGLSFPWKVRFGA